MKEIYSGKHLTIRYDRDEDLFIQEWNPSPDNIKDFKSEMLTYTKLYEKYRPKNTLWMQINFNLVIDDETKIWIEKNVNEPCFEYGNQKCAFVVGKDILSHIQTIDVFEKTNSCIIPKHFATEADARLWIFKDSIPEKQNDKLKFDGIDSKGNLIVRIPSNNIKNTFKNIHDSVQQELFNEQHKEKLTTLTKREKEILKLIVQDKKHQEIADLLFISLHTLRTHWKNIKQKLDVNSETKIKTLSSFLD